MENGEIFIFFNSIIYWYKDVNCFKLSYCFNVGLIRIVVGVFGEFYKIILKFFLGIKVYE